MHTVDLLDAAISQARALGIRVREDWMDGTIGGECEIAGERWLFLDLSQSPEERLAMVTRCLTAQAACLNGGPPRDRQHTERLSEIRRGLAQFAKDYEQFVPVPPLCDGFRIDTKRPDADAAA